MWIYEVYKVFALGLTEVSIAILQAVIGTRNRMFFIGRYIAEKSLTHFSLLKENGFIVTLHAKVCRTHSTPTRIHTQVQLRRSNRECLPAKSEQKSQ